MKEKQVESLTSLPERKEGIINTIAITNIVHVTYLSIVIVITCFFLVIEKEFVSMAAERQKEIVKLQDITTSLTLQLQERDEQIEELKQSLKGNYYNMYM